MPDDVIDGGEHDENHPSSNRWWERGASVVEYALLTALIALAAFVALRYLQTSTVTSLSTSGSAIVEAKG